MEELSKKIVLPGDYLAGCEEFLSSGNTFIEKDQIYSTVTGQIVEKGRQISVSNPKTIRLQPGQLVYGLVVEVRESKAMMELLPYMVEETGIIAKTRFRCNTSGIIHVASIKKSFVRSVKDEFRVGDIVIASVKQITPLLELSTLDNLCGVVKAFCSSCRNPMVLKDQSLICTSCKQVERRKISGFFNGNQNFKQ